MSHSCEEQLIENYFSQSPFNQLVMYPTLTPQLVPAGLCDSESSNESSGEARIFGNNITNAGQNEALPVIQKDSTASKPTDGDASVSPAVARIDIRDPRVLANIRLFIDGISWEDFLTQVLHTHGLDQDYRPGFPIRLWYTRSLGGEKKAPTISTEDEFERSKASILKKSGQCDIGIQFDLDMMDRYRIRNDASLVNGKNILILKAHHTCQLHKGEHGEPGHCYIAPNGAHVPLNNRKFAQWASAMTANEATKDTPPNCEDFEAAFHGQGEGPRPRGRTGPHPTSFSAPTTGPPSTSSVDINALLAVALLPMINRMTQDSANLGNGFVHGVNPAVLAISPQPNPSTATVAEITDFLDAFKCATQFDVMNRASTLADLDFTPSLIANGMISSTHLGEVLGLQEGGVLAIQKFAREWVARRDEAA
ncbi:hypothetical protein BGW80DRAFT_1463752 [Lactifluus volemus]|nr:hypothetical protein BGW80DRAFT_1463752 [Lactifluus volemus]